MTGLKMIYFVLKPESSKDYSFIGGKYSGDEYAKASRKALLSYAKAIKSASLLNLLSVRLAFLRAKMWLLRRTETDKMVQKKKKSIYRRYVPALIPTDELYPSAIGEKIEVCVNEFKDRFLPSREPVRTIVRIESVDFEQKPPIVYGVLPSWNPRQVIRFPISVIPERLRKYVKPDERFFVYVNLGAEDESELYFDGFDYRGK